MKRTTLLVASLVLAATAHAQSGGMQGMEMKGMDMKGMDKKAPQKSHHAVGVVKSVDASKGTLTLDHEPVASMKWPAMTMTFKAKDKKMLQSLAPGKKVEIDFVQQGKDYVVTSVK
jgi:Cu(I)/Ag(I) efflux system protein CusF